MSGHDNNNNGKGDFVTGASRAVFWSGAAVLAVLISLSGFWAVDDALSRFERALDYEFEYDMTAYSQPGVVLKLPAATEFRWTPFESDAYETDLLTYSDRSCKSRHCKATRAPSTFAGRGWTYLLVVPNASTRYGRYARGVRWALYHLFDDSDPRNKPLTLAYAERSMLGYTEIMDQRFPVYCGTGAAKCFDSIIRLDEYQKDSHYGRFNEWLRPILMDLAPAEGYSISLPLLMVIDNEGVIRFASYSDDPYALASRLLHFFGYVDQLFTKGLNRKNPTNTKTGAPGMYMDWDVHLCGKYNDANKNICFFDRKALHPLYPILRFFNYGSDPFSLYQNVLVPGQWASGSLEGTSDVEKSLYRLQQVGNEAVKAITP